MESEFTSKRKEFLKIQTKDNYKKERTDYMHNLRKHQKNLRFSTQREYLKNIREEIMEWDISYKELTFPADDLLGIILNSKSDTEIYSAIKQIHSKIIEAKEKGEISNEIEYIFTGNLKDWPKNWSNLKTDIDFTSTDSLNIFNMVSYKLFNFLFSSNYKIVEAMIFLILDMVKINIFITTNEIIYKGIQLLYQVRLSINAQEVRLDNDKLK